MWSIVVGRLPKSPERFELIEMSLTSASFSWSVDSQLAYRLHYRSLSADDSYRLIEVRMSTDLATFHIQYYSQCYCVCLSSSSSVVCDVMYVAKRCALEQKLPLTAYRKSYMRNGLVPKWMTLAFV